MCRQLFSSKKSVDEFVAKLVDVALHHNTDGWLVNIENGLDECHVANVVYFLNRLKFEMQSNVSSNCQVIWYDSVVQNGQLSWQNELNESNRWTDVFHAKFCQSWAEPVIWWTQKAQPTFFRELIELDMSKLSWTGIFSWKIHRVQLN